MAEETKNCCCSQRRKVRERTEEEALLQRLSRIEGQVRGVRGWWRIPPTARIS